MSEVPAEPTVLIVEDDPAVVELLDSYLSAEGFAVRHAGAGQEALASLATSGADVAVVDVMMPGTDGIGLLEQFLHEREGRPPLPMVVLVGSPEAAARCGQLLDDEDVVTKPVDPAEILTRLRNHLRPRGTKPT